MSTTLEPEGMYEGVPAYHFDNSAGGSLLSHQHRWDEISSVQSGFRSTIGPGFWVVTDGEAVQEALQDWRTFSNKSVTALNPEPAFLWIPEMLDPPLHTKWRRLLGREFSSNAIAAKENEIRRVAVGMIEKLKDSGGAEVLDGFARRFPTLIFMRLMGLPEQDLGRFLDWVHSLLHLSFEEDPDRSRQLAAITEVSAYFQELITQRRAVPVDDLLSRAMTWQIDGDLISDQDLHAFCILMFQAGLDTVPISIGWALYHFASHPEHRRAIVADPALIPTSVEETLRVYSFVVPARKATKDVEIGGCPVKAVDMVMLPLAVSNRDPQRYENSLEVELHRSTNNHIAFGSGPHRCLGSHLARLELNVAVEEWHRRIPDYRIADGQELDQQRQHVRAHLAAVAVVSGSPLRAADLYHTGIVVPDLEASLALLSEVAGYRWTQIQSAQIPVQLDDGERGLLLRYAYSLDAPHVELVQEVPGTPWSATAPGAAHHLGYFCDDVLSTSKRLQQMGFALEAHAVIDGRPAVFAYHLSPAGVRIEIVERARIPDFGAYLRERSVPDEREAAG